VPVAMEEDKKANPHTSKKQHQVIAKHPEITIVDLYTLAHTHKAFAKWREGKNVHFGKTCLHYLKKRLPTQ